MQFDTLASVILTVAIITGYINHRFVRMQATIAVMVSSLVLSLAVIIIGKFGFKSLSQQIAATMEYIDFQHLLINWMLSFLLFAAALTVDVTSLKSQKWEITVLSCFTTITATFLTAVLVFYFLPLLGFQLNFATCLLFGALISPTDPIAVLATLKKNNAPKGLETELAGESLFNDGISIVLFLTIYEFAFQNQVMAWQQVTWLFFQQAVGGVLYGVLLGSATFWLIKKETDHKMSILVTLAAATGGYTLAQAIDISGALAMVTAGIIVGNKSEQFSLSKKSHESLLEFWELVDQILNAVLFSLLGFGLLIIPFDRYTLTAAILAIPLVLLVRWITVAIPMSIFKIWRKYAPHTITILTWGGLKGGLAVALALALPRGPSRDIILTMTYAVVLFSVIAQGLTIMPLLRATQNIKKK